jgi:hypothetical protein
MREFRDALDFWSKIEGSTATPDQQARFAAGLVTQGLVKEFSHREGARYPDSLAIAELLYQTYAGARSNANMKRAYDAAARWRDDD